MVVPTNTIDPMSPKKKEKVCDDLTIWKPWEMRERSTTQLKRKEDESISSSQIAMASKKNIIGLIAQLINNVIFELLRISFS